MHFANGTYRGRSITGAFIVRFDFEGSPRASLQLVSGDIFDADFSLRNHVASFFSTQVETSDDGSEFTATLSLPALDLRGTLFCHKTDAVSAASPLQSQLRILNRMGAEVAQYSMTLEKVADSLRQIEIEIDRIEGTVPPAPYQFDGASITVRSCFESAGIELIDSGRGEVFPRLGLPTKWSERDLNLVMERQFTGFQPNERNWRLYVLICTEFRSDTTTGIMFDQFGVHRQGVAVFYDTRKRFSNTDSFDRDYLRTMVHEIGHACNLLHSFDANKRFGRRAAALSFMNYPQNFTGGGESAFWNNFRFQFESDELAFVRHGLLDEVIMGGRPFGFGGHDEAPSAPARPSVVGGLRLELRLQPERRANLFAFQEPVHVEAKLTNVSGEECQVQDALDPSHRLTRLLIRKPSGQVIVFSPLMTRCDERRAVVLGPEYPSLYEDVDLTYGTAGFTFVEPGRYEIQAVQDSEQGLLYSNVLAIWVQTPDPQLEPLLVDTLDEQVGKYLTVWGHPDLTVAHDRLVALADDSRGSRHPLTDHYRFCEGMANIESFSLLKPDRTIAASGAPAKSPDALLEAMGLDQNFQPKRSSSLSNIVYGHAAGVLNRDFGLKKVDAERLLASVAERMTKRGALRAAAAKTFEQRWNVDLTHYRTGSQPGATGRRRGRRS